MLRQAVDRYTTVQASDGIKLVRVPLAKKVKPGVGRGERAPKQGHGSGSGEMQEHYISLLAVTQIFHRIYIAKTVVSKFSWSEKHISLDLRAPGHPVQRASWLL